MIKKIEKGQRESEQDEKLVGIAFGNGRQPEKNEWDKKKISTLGIHLQKTSLNSVLLWEESTSELKKWETSKTKIILQSIFHHLIFSDFCVSLHRLRFSIALLRWHFLLCTKAFCKSTDRNYSVIIVLLDKLKISCCYCCGYFFLIIIFMHKR